MYKIFGVVVCKKDDPDFLYHNFIDKGSDEEMVEFVNKIRERSILVAPAVSTSVLSPSRTFRAKTTKRAMRSPPSPLKV